MSNWYYTKNGQATGPVSFDALKRIQEAGGLSAPDTMVWQEGTPDWVDPSTVEGLGAATAENSIHNPYAAPTKSANLAPDPTVTGELPIIDPGSSTINIGAVITKSWHTFKKHAGILIGAGIIAIVIQIALSIAAQLGFAIVISVFAAMTNGGAISAGVVILMVLGMIVFMVIQLTAQMFITLGIVKTGLNALSDNNPSINDLFSQGGNLLKTIGAGLLMYVVLFIVAIPGSIILAILVGIGGDEPSDMAMLIGSLAIYIPIILITIRLSFFVVCIVDQNCGAVDSLKQSWAMTRNNFWVLIGLAIVASIFVMAGALALIIGLFVAIPVAYLMYLCAYRWMRHGFRSCDLS